MTTMKKNLIIPEVVGEVADSHFGERMTLLPVTRVDTTLEGVPGDTLKFPCFRYIGKADEVQENGQVVPSVLSADTVEAKVKKYAKAVVITDEARMSSVGDPIGEAARQLAVSIDHALDEALFDTLGQVDADRMVAVDSLNADSVADALTLFGEELDGDKMLITDAKGFAALRKDPMYLRASDMGQRMIFSGVVGEIWGCQIVVTSRLKPNEQTGEARAYIVKPGALRLVSKRGTLVEKQREAEYMRDTLFASRHCACYLYDQGKCVGLVRYQKVEVVEDGVSATEGGKSGTTRLDLAPERRAPVNMRWVVRMSDAQAPDAEFGKPLTGVTPWVNGQTDMATGGRAWAHLYLVGDKDLLPVKEAVVMAVSK